MIFQNFITFLSYKLHVKDDINSELKSWFLAPIIDYLNMLVDILIYT